MAADDLLSGLMDATYRFALRVAREKMAEAGWYEFEEVLAQASETRVTAENLKDARVFGGLMYSRLVGEPAGTPPPPV